MKKNFMRKTAIVLTIALMATTGVFAADATDASVPSDVAGTAYETAVKALMEKEIITGDTDGSYHPDANLTRAQACIIVVKSMNPPALEVTGTATQPVAKSGFSDMTGYGWAEGYISYAVKHGVTNGYPDGTFKPGRNVTMNELITMVLRAAGYTDETIGGTWPSNYVAKATELALLENIPSPIPDLATKGMAAQMDYNALDKIEAANPPAGTPGQGAGQDKPDAAPNTAGMTYANGSFNSAMTAYDGKTISGKAVIYTYGKAKNYSATMEFSKKNSDYREDTVYKYKNARTPAFYRLESGKITEMIVPMDAGFSGLAYGVINDTLTTINADNESVTGLVTLTATKEIIWLGEKGLSGIPDELEYLNGEIYELNLSGGVIEDIAKAADPQKRGKAFVEISGTVNDFVTVESFADNVVKIVSADGGAMFEVRDNASVYVLDKGEYKTGKASSIKAGVEIRAYDISDDDEASADIVVISK